MSNVTPAAPAGDDRLTVKLNDVLPESPSFAATSLIERLGTTTPLRTPRPLNVSVAKPSHSTAGSKASAPFVSPALIESFRRSVLSAVLVSPVPHSVPG